MRTAFLLALVKCCSISLMTKSVSAWRPRPNGSLAYDFSEQRLQELQERLASVEDYEGFISALFEDFWRQTEIGLERVKHEINVVFSGAVHTAFDTLASTISSLEVTSSELLNTIVQSRTEFSNSVQRVSAWFSRSVRCPEQPFDLEVAIEAAVKITNNCFPGREICLNLSAAAVPDLPGRWLNPIVDLLCNCFQNAVEHNGSGGSPNLSLNVAVSAGGIEICVANLLHPSIHVENRAARIANMLHFAKSDDLRRATEEEGSGFIRLSGS